MVEEEKIKQRSLGECNNAKQTKDEFFDDDDFVGHSGMVLSVWVFVKFVWCVVFFFFFELRWLW